VRILTINAGSSSLKLNVLDDRDVVVGSRALGPVEGLGADELAIDLRGLGPFDAVGHRVVHGGPSFTQPVRVDSDVRRVLEGLCPLAPLHQRASLAGIDALMAHAPAVPNVACFDTGFHASLPPAASTYALPAAWNREHGLRRYGFHGLSHAYSAKRVAAIVRPAHPERLRVVSCHLGSGASIAAVEGGRSVDTSMGFTPLEGLVMATRSGSVDPGLLLWLHTARGIPVPELADALERRSGLLGLAGSADMETIVAGAREPGSPSALALSVYVHRVKAAIAAMSASLAGLDVVVFTGGVGEHAPAVRAAITEGLRFLGIVVDESRNAEARPDTEITGAGATVRTLVVEAREDLELAAGVRAALGATSP
jgi:acetate kinase